MKKSKVQHGHSRREFLKTGALGAFFLGSGLTVKKGFANIKEPGKAKNIIFMVSDGMSSGTLTMADVMTRRRDGRVSHWAQLYENNLANRALMDMASADHIVTDSAAAASSWGCGYRINNGGVNIGVNGEHHKPLLPIFSDAGKSTGLVTTTEITHATPAGFAANVESRNMGEQIAEQYLDRGIDVLLGGGNKNFSSDRRSDGRDLYAEFKEKGYQVALTKDELNKQSALNGSLLGIFSNGHLPYTIDHLNTPDLKSEVPTLAEMTELALNNLSRKPEGFILQVEGGRVDHAAHGNDLAGLIFDQMAFDDAIGVVRKYAENRDDTLVIITSDHGNANPGFNGAPNDRFDRVQNFRHTNSWVHRGLNEQSSISQIQERMEAATDIGISREQADAFRRSLQGTYEATYSHFNNPRSVLGQILANYTQINWIGRAHTADYVELCSFGPGSEAIDGFVENTALFDVVTKAAGVTEHLEW